MDSQNFSEELNDLLESLLNDELNVEQEQRLQELLNSSAQAQKQYLYYMDMHVGLMLAGRKQTSDTVSGLKASEIAPLSGGSESAAKSSSVTLPTRRFRQRQILIVGLLLALGIGWWGLDFHPFPQHSMNQQTLNTPAENETLSEGEPKSKSDRQEIVFSQNAHAVFYQEPAPRSGTPLKINHEYSLLQGEVEVLSPSGVRSIFEAPAIFRFNSSEQLLVSYGHCSVYVPEGAEGFEVLTPSTHLIDRGTRFFVQVDEGGNSEVHVVEGQVDVVHPVSSSPKSLWKGEAQHYSQTNQQASSSIPYLENTYRKQMRDRLVSFRGPVNQAGEIESLEEVHVMRDGELLRYQFSELIGGDVTSFCESGAPATVNLVQPKNFSGELQELLLHNNNFRSGALNPGGAKIPFAGKVLTPHETEERAQWTPGMTMTFHRPVVNSRGPDIVLFEIHAAVHPLQGDAFHIRPLELKPGYKPVTVTNYDLGILSPESHPLGSFVLLTGKRSIAQLDELLSGPLRESYALPNYRVVGTAIDLSDMGVPEGDAVSAVFIQDAMDDHHRIDPVMIVGLPEISAE